MHENSNADSKPPSLPPPLRGNEPGSFAEDTLSRRLPGIARRRCWKSDWHPQAAARLQALADEMPHGRLRPLAGPRCAGCRACWQAYLQPYLGQTWLEAPWFAGWRSTSSAASWKRPAISSLDRAGASIPTARKRAKGLAGVAEALERRCASGWSMPSISAG